MTHQLITADWSTLMRQAPATAGLYLSEAVTRIDAALGSGYAAKHPDLIAAFLSVCAADFGAASLAVGMQTIAAALTERGGEDDR